jgi:DNA-binding MarR family transcriptional regulator
MTATTLEELNQAMGLLQFAFRKVVEEPDRILAKRGLGRVHHRVLYFIARNRRLSVGDLLRVLAVSKQALHGPLQQLVRSGLVLAEPAPGNRRIKLLRLTKEGAALEDRVSASQRSQFARAFERAGKARTAGWRGVMEALAGEDPFGRDRLPSSSAALDGA